MKKTILGLLSAALCLAPLATGCSNSFTGDAAAYRAVSYPAWTEGVYYNTGDYVSYNGNTYQCIFAHTALGNWTPEIVPALWKLIGSGAQTPVTPSDPEPSRDTDKDTPAAADLTDGGIYTIVAQCSDKAIDVAEYSTTPGSNIHQWTLGNGQANQQWILTKCEDSYWVIKSVHSGYVLDIDSSKTEDGANICQWYDNRTSNQKWAFERLSDGYYKIVSQNSGKVIDVSSASTQDGANIQQWTWNGTPAQKWRLTKVSTTEQQPQPPVDENTVTVDGRTYRLTFSDDFNGSSLDSSKWERCPEWQRQDLGGYWENDCSYVTGGNLVIECRNNNGTLQSGAVRSRGKFEQTGGVYRIRFKAEKSSALWYAFWLMTDAEANIGNGATDGAEIDIFEIIGNDPWMPAGQKAYLNSAVHYDGYGDAMKSVSSQYHVDDSFFGQWHEATFVWTDDGYKLYMDNNPNPIWNARGSEYGGTCTTANYIKITAEFGIWGGEIINSLLPAHFYVDWVKVYN